MMEKTCKRSRRRKGSLALTLAFASIAGVGCDDSGNPFVVSLQPFCTKSDLQTDPLLWGTWTDKDGEVSFSFTEGAEKEYQLTVKETEGGRELSGEFEAHLFRLGGTWFIDLSPKSTTEGDEFYRIHFLRAHSIARIDVSEDSMHIAFLSASWLKQKAEEHTVDTPHEEVDGSLLLTGTTEEVQELAFLYSNDDEAFPDPLFLERHPADEVTP